LSVLGKESDDIAIMMEKKGTKIERGKIEPKEGRPWAFIIEWTHLVQM